MTARFAALAFVLAAASAPGRADGVRFEVAWAAGEKFTITERADLRRFEDNRFMGLSYREVRGVLDVRAGERGAEASGSFLVFEETKRNMRLAARRIDETVPVRFTIRPNGTYEVAPDQQLPALRSFPVFPDRALSPGDKWEAFGVRVVEPLRDGQHTRVRFYAGYEYQGPVVRDGRDLQLVTARYALRYRGGDDPYGDPRLRSVSGTHSAKIYLDAEARKPVFVETLVDEAYTFDGQKPVGYRGFILTWYEGVAPMDRGRVADEIRAAVADVGPGPLPGEPGEPREGGPGTPRPGGAATDMSGPSGAPPGVTVRETDEGVTLSIPDIRFVADQAVILPEERPRLEAVARALKKVERRTFRVVGHTARFGTEAGQKALSVDRARAIVDFLVASGLEADRFVYEGRGASQPVASNDTPEGMAANRRVEIIILED